MKRSADLFRRLLPLLLLLFCCVIRAQELAADYADADLWVYRESGAPAAEQPADIFFICPTTCMRRTDNMDVYDERERAAFKKAVDMEKGIYCDRARFFAPYYRQKSLPHYGKPGVNALAYADVKAAFLHYLAHDNGGRPFILAGFSQGSEHALHLIKDLPAIDGSLAERMIAAYLIGWCVTERDTAEAPHLRPAQGETDTGVFIAWNTESADTKSSFLVPSGERAYCINPLNWRTDATPAPAEKNLGARFTLTDLTAPALPAHCGAVINPVRGTLNPIFSGESPRPILFGRGIYHVYDPILFYENHRANVNTRIRAFLRIKF